MDTFTDLEELNLFLIQSSQAGASTEPFAALDVKHVAPSDRAALCRLCEEDAKKGPCFFFHSRQERLQASWGSLTTLRFLQDQKCKLREVAHIMYPSLRGGGLVVAISVSDCHRERRLSDMTLLWHQRKD